MHIQKFQPQEVSAAHGDRIQVPSTAGALAGPPSQPPSLIGAIGREAWRRKRLLAVWGVVTIGVTAAVVLVFAQPLYRAEGKLSYRPNYSRGLKPIYTPPNIQSAVQILKAPEVLEPVRERHMPNMSKEEFAKNVRVEVSKQSEFLDVGFDHPNPAVATAVADDLMAEGLKNFRNIRVQTTRDSITEVSHDLQSARKQLEAAKEDYRKACDAHGIGDPLVEQESLRVAISDIEAQLRIAREKQAKLKLEIKFLEARRDAPADATDETFDDNFFPVLQSMMHELQTRMVNQQAVDTAKFKFEAAQNEANKLRPLVAKGIYPQIEYDKVVAEMRIHESTLKHGEEVKQLREELQKRYDELKKKAASSKPNRKAVNDQLELLKKDEATAPATIIVLTEDLNLKKKSLNDLQNLKRDLGEKDDNIKLIWNRVQDFHAQLTDAAERTQDLNANDLRIHSPATAGTTPYSTNAPKLGLALVGTSALLLVGYLALFALPTASASAASRQAVAPGMQRALIALVPYIQGIKGQSVSASETHGKPSGPGQSAHAPHAEPAVQAIAERMLEEGVDPGGIVLFAPTTEQLQVGPVVGGLSEVFRRRGERVLVFDARQAAETPDWAGPQAPSVARNVERYLDGNADGSAECFVPTSLDGVEYSRADLSQRVSGVFSAHRFRQLVEQMKERYSVVFLVAPPVSLEEGDPMLAMLAEGMVLVTETSANPVEVHAYLDTLCQQVPARLYGTVAVPKAA
jgi:uncharacterized protein involved in exopolysaccharide biosynthesis